MYVYKVWTFGATALGPQGEPGLPFHELLISSLKDHSHQVWSKSIHALYCTRHASITHIPMAIHVGKLGLCTRYCTHSPL